MKKNALKTGAKAGAYSAILTVIVIAAAIVVNLIVSALPSKYTKIDTSQDSVFSFSEKTEKYVEQIAQDINVYHVCEGGYEDKYLTEVLDRYGEMNSHIKVERIDPIKNPTFIEKYTDQSLASNSLIISCGDTTKIVPFGEIYYVYVDALQQKFSIEEFEMLNQQYYQYYGMTMEQYYYNMTGAQLTYSVNFAGENAIVSGIDYVTSDELPKLYVLSGHGEASLNAAVSSLLDMQNYVCESFSFTNEAPEFGTDVSAIKPIPEDADTILITSPQTDISESELEALRAYVLSGGNLVIAGNYLSPKLENFNKLAQSYGLDISTSILMEGNASFYSGYPYNIYAQVGTHETTSGVTSAKVYLAHGIRVAETMPENMTASVLLSTSDKSFAKPLGYDTTKIKTTKEEGDIEGPLSVAVLVECEGAGSVAWFSSDYYLTQTADQGFCSVYSSVVGHLCGKVETFTVDAVKLTSSYLEVTESSATMWGVITIGIIPLAFIGTGFAVWLRRRSK